MGKLQVYNDDSSSRSPPLGAGGISSLSLAPAANLIGGKELAIAKFSFKPQKEKDLEFKVGETITVEKKR